MSNNFSKWFGLVSGGVGIIGFAQSLRQNKRDAIILDYHMQKLNELQELSKMNMKDLIQNESFKNFMTSKTGSLLEKYGEIKNNNDLIKETLNNLTLKTAEFNNTGNIHIRDEINYINNLLQYYMNRQNEDVKKGSDIIDSIKNYVSNNNGNNFRILDSINDFYAHLTPEQTLCVIHICLSIGMFFSLMTISSILFGDLLINKYKLDVRYPKLARFILLRNKIKNYSVAFNIILIMVALFGIVYVNILYLLYR